jgi:hypothetical protein
MTSFLGGEAQEIVKVRTREPMIEKTVLLITISTLKKKPSQNVYDGLLGLFDHCITIFN